MSIRETEGSGELAGISCCSQDHGRMEFQAGFGWKGPGWFGLEGVMWGSGKCPCPWMEWDDPEDPFPPKPFPDPIL